MKKKNSLVQYVKDSVKELSKVTWLTKNQAVKLTMIVFGFCLVAAFALGAVDYLLDIVHKKYLLNL